MQRKLPVRNFLKFGYTSQNCSLFRTIPEMAVPFAAGNFWKCKPEFPPSPHFNDAKMARFCSFAPSALLWGNGGLLFLFVVSKIAILDKINETSGPPLTPFQ